METIFYVGSYTEMITPHFGGKGIGIATLSLNESTGNIKLLHNTPSLNAGYLTFSDDKQFLYTITEVLQSKKPTVKAYKINHDKSLEFINELPIQGSLPCHISFLNKQVFVSCYGTGNILKFVTNSKGELIKETHNIKHQGSSINVERQESSHAHQVVVHPNKKELFVPDLGIDKIKVYSIKDNNLVPKIDLDIKVDPGFGPRHIEIQPYGDLAYVIGELIGKVAILKNIKGCYKIVDYVDSLPSSFDETPGSSAIRLHPNLPYLYVANRTIDAITIFKITGDSLELIYYQYTEGITLREFNITPSGKWLIASLQDSDEIIIYEIDMNGRLLEKNRTQLLNSGVCVAFL